MRRPRPRHGSTILTGTTHTRFAAALVAAAAVVVLSGVPSGAQTFPPEPEMGLHGSFTTSLDWRRGHRSSAIRQDLDVTSMLDVTYRPDKSWDFALSVSGTGDVDGRRPSFEPGIYNGIAETFDHAVQPWLYRLYGRRALDIGFGPGRLTGLTLGRQYTAGEEFVWIDGAELTGEMPLGGADATFAVYGGVPVRLFESQSGDWLIGGRTALRIGRARVGLEAYHVEDETWNKFVRKDNIGRFSLSSPIGDQAHLYAMVRGIDDEGLDGRARIAVNLPREMQVRFDARFQTEARSAHANEVDAASLVLGRASGLMRQAYMEYGGDLLIPIDGTWSVDVGATTREFDNPQNLNNINFDRYFAALQAEGLRFAGRKAGGSATFEAYRSAADWTRTATGEAHIDMTDRLRLGIASTYALYSYDYLLNQISNDVRVLTAKLRYKATDALRFDLRYDAEDDDYRLHHYVHAGFRYDF